MKIGIHITGLGQSFVNESVEKYAERLLNEMAQSSHQVAFEKTSENINYGSDRESTVVTIFRTRAGVKEAVYRLYDFKYDKILTEKFSKKPILLKSFFLLLLALRKFPLLCYRIFSRKNYGHPWQTLYIFGLFLVIALGVLFLLPASISAATGLLEEKEFAANLMAIKKSLRLQGDIPFISIKALNQLAAFLLPFINLLLLLVPQANTMITSLATEFICANDYIEHGAQRQLVQGNLELLVDHITEANPNVMIHLHAYSFGTVMAIDYLFPFGSVPSANAQKFIDGLVTIGAPMEFLDTYYPGFYTDRNATMETKIKWLNVHSVVDPLATNFRRDNKAAEAQFGVPGTRLKPTNLNYEVVKLSRYGLWSFLFLNSIKVHGMYWDSQSDGLSCLRLVHNKMTEEGMVG